MLEKNLIKGEDRTAFLTSQLAAHLPKPSQLSPSLIMNTLTVVALGEFVGSLLNLTNSFLDSESYSK